MADPEIKIKRYADKENLKELIKYCKATFANKDGSTSGGGGSEVGDATIKINYGSTNLGSFTTNQSADAIVDIHPINTLISENYYTKKQIDTMIESGSGGTGGDYYTKSEIDTKLNSKANTSDLSNYYTKSEVDNLLSYISVYSITKEEIEEICVL